MVEHNQVVVIYGNINKYILIYNKLINIELNG